MLSSGGRDPAVTAHSSDSVTPAQAARPTPQPKGPDKPPNRQRQEKPPKTLVKASDQHESVGGSRLRGGQRFVREVPDAADTEERQDGENHQRADDEKRRVQ